MCFEKFLLIEGNWDIIHCHQCHGELCTIRIWKLNCKKLQAHTVTVIFESFVLCIVFHALLHGLSHHIFGGLLPVQKERLLHGFWHFYSATTVQLYTKISTSALLLKDFMVQKIFSGLCILLQQHQHFS